MRHETCNRYEKMCTTLECILKVQLKLIAVRFYSKIMCFYLSCISHIPVRGGMQNTRNHPIDNKKAVYALMKKLFNPSIRFSYK